MINTIDFINDLKQYITTKFSLSSNFSNVKVARAYDSENKNETPQISVYISNSKERENTNSYESENISIIRVTFYCYNKSMLLENNNEKTSAIDSTTMLCDELQEIFNKNVFSDNNSNIISSTRKSYVQPQSIREDGIVYVGILTYEFNVLNDYTKIYNN